MSLIISHLLSFVVGVIGGMVLSWYLKKRKIVEIN